MKNAIHTIIKAGAVLGTAVSLSAVTVSFDDLATPSNNGGMLWGYVPGTYAGLNWNTNPSWEVGKDATFLSVYHNTNPSPSSPNIAYNDTGWASMRIWDGSFVFEGASVRSWGYNNAFASYSAHQITVKGYLNGAYVGEVQLDLDAAAWQQLPGINGVVDELVWDTEGGERWFLMDDLQYTAVPDGGATLVLLGLAISGFAVTRRKSR
ncbi:MAG: VPDSG-CTERM sorting domain-containing protein [Verrucomicrobiales bacterium]|nr:VPDSG-CTERM sorting domain-containing protein [Verrucomicrobiales bacterium]